MDLLDKEAVKRVANSYNGFYMVKRGCSKSVVRYDNDYKECSLEINFTLGEVMIRLKEPHNGSDEAKRPLPDYITLHKIFNKPRSAFEEEEEKPRPKRRKSREEAEEDPITFSLTAIVDPAKQAGALRPATPSSFSLTPYQATAPLSQWLTGRQRPGVGVPDLGLPVAGLGPTVPSGPPLSNSRGGRCYRKRNIDLENICNKEDTEERIKIPKIFPKVIKAPVPAEDLEETESDKEIIKTPRFGPALPPTPNYSKDYLEKTKKNILALDPLYRDKTKYELEYLKKKHEQVPKVIEEKAKLSHKEKIEGFNKKMEKIPVHFECRRINWSKH